MSIHLSVLLVLQRKFSFVCIQSPKSLLSINRVLFYCTFVCGVCILHTTHLISRQRVCITLLGSFHAQFVSNLVVKVLEDAGPNEGQPVLSASQLFEEFALEYAENHLNETDNMTIVTRKMGELLD